MSGPCRSRVLVECHWSAGDGQFWLRVMRKSLTGTFDRSVLLDSQRDPVLILLVPVFSSTALQCGPGHG